MKYIALYKLIVMRTSYAVHWIFIVHYISNLETINNTFDNVKFTQCIAVTIQFRFSISFTNEKNDDKVFVYKKTDKKLILFSKNEKKNIG